MILYLIYGFGMATCTVSPLSRFTAHLLPVYRAITNERVGVFLARRSVQHLVSNMAKWLLFYLSFAVNLEGIQNKRYNFLWRVFKRIYLYEFLRNFLFLCVIYQFIIIHQWLSCWYRCIYMWVDIYFFLS